MSADAVLDRIFEGAREDLLQALGKHRYALWFRDVAIERVEGRRVVLGVPTEVHRTWLEFNYVPLLARAFGRVIGEGVEVDLVVSERLAGRRAVRDRLPGDEKAWRALVAERAPSPTFDAFVAEGADAFPARLLRSLAEGHGEGGAALVVLHGPTGAGKTHLLRALAAAADRTTPGASSYGTGRDWTRRTSEAVRSGVAGALDAVREDLASRRVVCLDGLEEVAGRRGTERVLEATLERGLAAGVRFAVAARAHPRDLPTLSDRVRSRLLSGVVVRCAPPEGERLERVLTARARAHGLALPVEVRAAILARGLDPRASVDWLDRWAAVGARDGAPLGAEWIEEAAPAPAAATTRDRVVHRAKDVVSRHYGLRKAALEGAGKQASARWPRRLAIYLAYRACSMPLADLARSFGLRSHSTVSRAIHEVRDRRRADPSVEVLVDDLLARL